MNETWTAEGLRPHGQPGSVWYGEERESSIWPGEVIRIGLSYPAVLDDEGDLYIWRDSGWIESNGYSDFFDPDEEWKSECTHSHAVPWRTCDTRSQCWSLTTKEEVR